MKFKYEEIINSNTAKMFNIDNSLPIELIGNLVRTIQGLTLIRSLLNVPIIINSGYRSLELNKKIGGVENSHHTLAYAIDFYPKMDLKKAYDLIAESDIPFDQLILYPKRNFIHVSFHPQNRRQLLVK